MAKGCTPGHSPSQVVPIISPAALGPTEAVGKAAKLRDYGACFTLVQAHAADCHEMGFITYS